MDLMNLEFLSETIEVDGTILNGSISELENAVLALFWTGDKPSLGSVSISLPNKTSSQLLGNRDEILNRMVGELLASKYGKLALISTNLPVGFEASKALFELADRLSGDHDV
jgi:hypothetical protein